MEGKAIEHLETQSMKMTRSYEWRNQVFAPNYIKTSGPKKKH